MNIPAMDSHAAFRLPFPMVYYEGNLALLQRDLRERGLAAALLFDPESIFWLTGYQSIGYFTFQCLFVPRQGRPALVSRRVNQAIGMAMPTIATFVAIEDTDDPVTVLTAFLKRETMESDALGLETASWYLTVQAYRALAGACGRTLVDWGGVIEGQRRRKTPEQLGFMRRAAAAAVAGLDSALEATAVGRTENDLAAAMLHGATTAGSEFFRVPLVVVGPSTELCFTTWRRRSIRYGDVVFLESAACVHRYHAMIARCAVAGEATAEQRRRAGLIIEALDRAIEAIRPGVTSEAVDAACRRVFEDAGFGRYFDHRTAYAIGIGFPPNWAEGRFLALKPGDSTVLEPGMTFHIVPSLFMPDFGMCFSESVAVTSDGCEVLTDYPRQLFEIGC